MPSALTEGLLRVRELAYRNPKLQFTSLLHQATPQIFEIAFYGLRQNAAYGVDKVQWHDYENDKHFKGNLMNLRERVLNGTYKPLPVKRVYIPKQDGKSMRPLGIAAIEDKIVQNVIRIIIEPLYESIFQGFSYGFRTNTGCHDALDALYVCIAYHKVNYVLDADIKGYFDSIPHGKLLSLINIRIGDPRILNLIKKWLNCGVLEKELVTYGKTGTVQGAVISPLLANIYLHYVLDEWVVEWRRIHARGEVYIVRYADDFIVAFQYMDDATKFWTELEQRLGRYELQLQTDKSRLIEFGRFAGGHRIGQGVGPKQGVETFDFLGFTHICSVDLKGKFKLLRKTIGKRLNKKIQEYKGKLKCVMHMPLDTILKWLNRSLIGYYNYYAIHDNLDTLCQLRYFIICDLGKVLMRRSQKAKKTVNWDYVFDKIAPLIPFPKIVHDYPIVRFRQKWQRV